MSIKLIFRKNLAFYFLITILFISFPIQFNLGSNKSSVNPNVNFIQTSTNSSTIDLSKLPEIDEEMWYKPKIEMLVITPDIEDFINAVTPLVEWKNERGLKTIILSNFSSYSGRDDAEKIRNMIKSYYNKEDIKWVLLAGDAEDELIPIRYVYNPDVIEVGGGEKEYSSWDNYYKPTDFYYADLTGSWDDDNDNKFGESAKYNYDNIDEISWTPEVYVGRLPARSALELELMVNKTLEYEKDPQLGNWTNRMLLAGGISEDTIFFKEDEARLTEYIWQNFVLSKMNFTHLVKTTSDFTPDEPPTPNNQTVLNWDNFDFQFNRGYSAVLLASHGDPTKFTSVNLGTIYDNNDASSCKNFNMPSLFYGDACTTSSYDKNDNSIGEILIKRQNAGAIGYIGGLRVTWYVNNDTDLEYLNRGNARLFWRTFFNESIYQQGEALYESKVAYMNSDIFLNKGSSMYFEWHRKNVLTYCLLGDPELDIYTNKPYKAMNPFNESHLEGKRIHTIIRNIKNESIPYARVHLSSRDGKYRTFYADKNGFVSLRLPPQVNETYYVTITGHNLIPSYFNFTTLVDLSAPHILNVDWSPKAPSTLHNVCFNITTYDNRSGVESVFILLSKNNFKDYTYFRINVDNLQAFNIFEYQIDKLDPGDYSFAFYVRNFANNSELLYKQEYSFSVPVPIVDYFLIAILIMCIGLLGISILKAYKGLRKR